MSMTATANDQQLLWNGVAGRAWVDLQRILDGMFVPVERALLGAIEGGSGRRVLDIGCGTGATTLATQRLLGPVGKAVGIDISQPMVALARERARQEGLPAEFICGDPQEGGIRGQAYDWVISRFGVMFFSDPVRAFGNIREATRPDARLRAIAWRSCDENGFMAAAESGAAGLLPGVLPDRTNEPVGQFAFADPRRVERLLDESGWADVELNAVDFDCTFPASDLETYFTRMGPLGRIIPELAPEVRAELVERLHAAFEPYVDVDQVRFTAACWQVDARAA